MMGSRLALRQCVIVRPAPLLAREVIVNEINTIPGFTKISMYPKMWEASGISYKDLIDRLIQLALERFRREKKLKTSFRL